MRVWMILKRCKRAGRRTKSINTVTKKTAKTVDEKSAASGLERNPSIVLFLL